MPNSQTQVQFRESIYRITWKLCARRLPAPGHCSPQKNLRFFCPHFRREYRKRYVLQPQSLWFINTEWIPFIQLIHLHICAPGPGALSHSLASSNPFQFDSLRDSSYNLISIPTYDFSTFMASTSYDYSPAIINRKYMAIGTSIPVTAMIYEVTRQ